LAGALTCGASGAIGRVTSGRVVAGVARSAVGVGAGGGTNTGAAGADGVGVGGGAGTGVAAPVCTVYAGLVSRAAVLATTACATTSGGEPVSGAGARGSGGAMEMRKSSAARRLSFHGKFRPGMPKVWPPRDMLNSSTWHSKESCSAMYHRDGPR
ncbi:MAG: hypothetical protein WKG03_14385, partial [Telluria sp.]